MRRFETFNAAGKKDGEGVVWSDGTWTHNFETPDGPMVARGCDASVLQTARYLDPPEGEQRDPGELDKLLEDEQRFRVALHRLSQFLLSYCSDLPGKDITESVDRGIAIIRVHGKRSPEPTGKLPSEQITEWQWDEYRRMRKERGDEDTNRFFEHELRVRDPLLLRAVIRYLDEQHRERLVRAPGKDQIP